MGYASRITSFLASRTLAIITIMHIGGAAVAVEPPRHVVDPFWPKPLPENWILGHVAGVAIDAQDNVWILQRPRSLADDEKAAAVTPPIAKCCSPAPAVIKFNAEGTVVQHWGGPGSGYDWPGNEHGIYIDPKGFVWIAGNGPQDGMILKFTPEGQFVMQIGRSGPTTGSNDTAQLGAPADLFVDPEANELYVADGYRNHRIIVFDSETGAYKRHWGAYGKPPTDNAVTYDPKGAPPQQFNNPVHCVAMSKDGLIYVCDRRNDRIQVFKKDGTFVKEFFISKETLGNGTTGAAFPWPIGEQPYLVVANSEDKQVLLVDRNDGKVLTEFGRGGRYAGDFYQLHNLAVDSKGNIFTTEIGNKRIQKFLLK